MKFEIITPSEYMGEVTGDITKRRGQVEEVESRIGNQVIRGRVPLAEMFGYATGLRSLTKGRASYSMEPAAFEKVPENILAIILDKLTGEKAAQAQKK